MNMLMYCAPLLVGIVLPPYFLFRGIYLLKHKPLHVAEKLRNETRTEWHEWHQERLRAMTDEQVVVQHGRGARMMGLLFLPVSVVCALILYFYVASVLT